MNNGKNYESTLWQLLEKEKLADLSQFHRPHFFEEVPLFSRAADIAFLARESQDATNEILLRFALKFLKSVVAYEEHRTPFFAAVTIWDLGDDDPIVPHLFVWSDTIRNMRARLKLNAAKEGIGKKIKRLVGRLRLPESFEVCEDTSTSDEMTRVFIGPVQPPYPAFVPMTTFRKAAVSAK